MTPANGEYCATCLRWAYLRAAIRNWRDSFGQSDGVTVQHLQHRVRYLEDRLLACGLLE